MSGVDVIRGLVKKPRRCVVDEAVRGRRLVVEIHGDFARLREFGRRAHYDVPWAAVYTLGAKMEAARLAREAEQKKAVAAAARR